MCVRRHRHRLHWCAEAAERMMKTWRNTMKTANDLNDIHPKPAHGRGSEPPSHGRGGGGADDRPPPPPRTRKLRKIATSGKRRWIGRGKFYKKYLDHFLIRSNLRSQGVKRGQIRCFIYGLRLLVDVHLLAIK